MKHIKLFEEWNQISEKIDIDRVEFFADKFLEPIDVEFTKHFMDQLTRPEHAKEVTDDELINFFKRLSMNKRAFANFMKKWDQFVITDKQTQINIPFKSKVDQIIAKTIMRKKDFKTSNKNNTRDSEPRSEA